MNIVIYWSSVCAKTSSKSTKEILEQRRWCCLNLVKLKATAYNLTRRGLYHRCCLRVLIIYSSEFLYSNWNWRIDCHPVKYVHQWGQQENKKQRMALCSLKMFKTSYSDFIVGGNFLSWQGHFFPDTILLTKVFCIQ